ncbi:hypothetical protein AB1N83_002061 [Pleurotus pulmonarius]
MVATIQPDLRSYLVQLRLNEFPTTSQTFLTVVVFRVAFPLTSPLSDPLASDRSISLYHIVAKRPGSRSYHDDARTQEDRHLFRVDKVSIDISNGLCFKRKRFRIARMYR